MNYFSSAKSLEAPCVSGNYNFCIEFKDWSKLLGYAKAAYKEYKSEIGGMMVLSECEDGDYLLSHPVILEQSISASATTINKEALAHYYTKSFQKHGKDVRFVWWHSHGTMDAFMSFIDEKTIQEYSNGDWSLSLVFNIFGSYSLRVQVFNPLNFAVTADLDILNHPVNKPASQSIVNEVKNKIAKSSSPIISHGQALSPFDNLAKNSYQIKTDMAASFAPRLYVFVAEALADYRDEKIDYGKLRHILMDIDAFAGYFDYSVDCPLLIEIDDLLRREKNPASRLVFKIEDIWE